MRAAGVLVLVLCATCGVPRARQPMPSPQPAPSQPPSQPSSPAAQTATAPSAVLEPRVAIERPDGALMRPGTTRYRLTLARGGQVIPLGTRTVDVTESTLGGTPGWLVAEARIGSAVPTSDSLWLARADLAPTRWMATVGTARMGASFSRDSVFGAVQSYQGRFSFATALPSAALLTGGMIDRLVEMLPLRVGYRAAVSLLRLEFGAPRTVAAELVVEREERVRVGAMDVDCWVVGLRAGALEERRWVAKDGRRVVRTVQATADGVLVGEMVP